MNGVLRPASAVIFATASIRTGGLTYTSAPPSGNVQCFVYCRILNMTGFAEPDQEMAQFFGTVGKPKVFNMPAGPGPAGMHPKRRREAATDSSAKLAGVGPGRVGASGTLSKPAPELKLKQGSIATFCSPPGLAARRGAEAVAAGHKYGAVVQPRTELSTTAPVPDSSCLQEASTRGAHLGVGTCAFETSHGNSTFPRAQGTPPQGAEHTGAAENSSRYGVEGQPGLGFPDLESTTSSSGTGQHPTPNPGHRDVQQAGVLHHASQERCGTSFPLHTQTHGNHGLQGHLPSGPVGPQQTRVGDMGPNGGPAGMLCVPADRIRLQTGEARQRASGAEDPRHAQVIVRQVIIHQSWQQLLHEFLGSDHTLGIASVRCGCYGYGARRCILQRPRSCSTTCGLVAGPGVADTYCWMDRGTPTT